MSTKVVKKISKKLDKLTIQWTVNMGVDLIEKEVENQLINIQSKVNINGFRQGKAPLNEIDKRYGEDALYRAVNKVIRDSINEIIQEEGYKLAVQPEVSFESEIKRKQNIIATVTLINKPKVPDVRYEKISINVAELELSEKDKDEELELFRKRMAKQELAEDGKIIKDGDMVDIDFVGRKTEDNVEFAGGSAKGYKLEIGSHAFINGFEEQIVGHKKGDIFDINVKFPDNYHVSELKGKDAVFVITINDVYEKKLPDINDEFVKNLGFKSIDEIKKLLFGNVKNIYENRMKNILKNQIFTSIIEKNKFDLPETVIEREVNERLNEDKEKNKDNKKWNEKESRKKIELSLHNSYAGFYLIDSVAEKNAIDVSEEEIKQFAAQDAIRNGMDVNEVLDKVEKDEKTKNYIYFLIKETKVFEFVFERIQKNVKKLDKKEFEKFIEDESKKIKV